MDCGVPFCHTGTLIEGMAVGLPDQQPHSGVERPGLSRPVAGGAGAAAQDQQLPGVHRPGLPGAVRGVVRAGHQRAAGHDQEHRVRHHRQGLRGGLGRRRSRRRCAPARRWPWSAPARRGWPAPRSSTRPGTLVTVFERADRIGGLLMYGIPNMKLDKQHRPAPRRSDGGRGRRPSSPNCEVGKDYPAAKLREEFDAVVLCGGATQAQRLLRQDGGPQPARASTSRWSSCTPTPRACSTATTRTASTSRRKDKDVVVIGGGDTGTDCVGTSLRHGCKSILQLEIVPMPPLTRAPDNPWPQWPKVYKLDYGQEEAEALFGDDPRQYAIQTTKFVGDANGHVKEIHTVRVEWVKDNGRAMPRNDPRHGAGLPGPAGAARDGLRRAGEPAARPARRGEGRAHATPRRSTASSPPACRACSPRATCGAARAWSCGRSTRAAGPRASATAF